MVNEHIRDGPKLRKNLHLHRWPGHMARAHPDTECFLALTENTRSTMVERDAQRNTSQNGMWCTHRDFSCWRWEAQITEFKKYEERRSRKHKRQHGVAARSTRQDKTKRQ